MTCAYDRTYLALARETLGSMLDYAVWNCKYDMDEFFALFTISGLADRFGHGDPKLIAGTSGVELAWKTLEKTQASDKRPTPRYNLNRSKAYWVGWAMAHCQWATGLSFRQLTDALPPSRFEGLYSPYHERDERALVDKFIELYRQAKPETNLKILRNRRGLSQAQLANAAGIPVRTIQQYEQRQKDIRKASAGSVLSIARVIGCSVEDMIEPDLANISTTSGVG